MKTNLPLITDHTKNTAARYRAIVSNREVGATPEQQREWDSRVLAAETSLAIALVNNQLMAYEDHIDKVTVEDREILITFFSRSPLLIHV